jgi:hypothetical protein
MISLPCGSLDPRIRFGLHTCTKSKLKWNLVADALMAHFFEFVVSTRRVLDESYVFHISVMCKHYYAYIKYV